MTGNEYISSADDLDGIISKLKSYGVVIVPDFFSPESIDALDAELDPHMRKAKPKQVHFFDGPSNHRAVEDQYAPGIALRISPPSYCEFPNLSRLFVDNSILATLIDMYYGTPNRKFMQVFAYHDTIPKEEEWEPGKTDNSGLHFDPYQAIKFATYLTDTSEANGMTSFIPGSHREGKHFRENVLKPTTWRGKQILDCHTPFKQSIYTEVDAVCPSLKRGTLVIFNTDIWHAGGEVKQKGLERKCIIFHNRKR